MASTMNLGEERGVAIIYHSFRQWVMAMAVARMMLKILKLL